MLPGLPTLPGFLWPGLICKVLSHHGEPADPTLLTWIKHRLDQLLELGPWTVVGVLGVLLVAMPVALVVFYLVQRGRMSSASPALDEPYGDSAP